MSHIHDHRTQIALFNGPAPTETELAEQADGTALKELPIGEYLVEQMVVTRVQLFRALQMQDRNPGVRLGECIAALGFASYQDIQRHLDDLHDAPQVTLD